MVWELSFERIISRFVFNKNGQGWLCSLLFGDFKCKGTVIMEYLFGCDFNYWVLDQIDYVWHLIFQHPEWALTAWDGVWMVTVSLMFDLIMRLCTDHVVGDFLRRVFGKLRLQNELHSLCGQQHRGKSFQVTFYFWGRVIFYCNCIVARELWTLFSMFGV